MDPLSEAIAEIRSSVPDARKGLPQDVFFMVSRLTPMCNVDLLIRNQLGECLLTWRADNFYGPGWHIPGGIIRFKERWEDRIKAVAAGELGTTVDFDPVPINVLQAVNTERDTRGHFISLLFNCTLTGPLCPDREFKSGKPLNGEWAWHKGCPEDILPIHGKLYGPFLDAVARGER